MVGFQAIRAYGEVLEPHHLLLYVSLGRPLARETIGP